MTELPPQYDPATVEEPRYQWWEAQGLFCAEAEPNRKPYTIVIPPPNITGILHMGHALNNTIQDILIRTKRMQGFNALWVPGTDHA
ncbi:MAG: class I tRNA ligase family protein, partial [Candidatus Omnitrophica bacterium]|nr:class I tRNA ligase family protein [Candidatus Omnitrophota bacterium]